MLWVVLFILIIICIVFAYSQNHTHSDEISLDMPEHTSAPPTLSEVPTDHKTKSDEAVKINISSELRLSERAKNALRVHEEYVAKSSNPKWHRTPEEKAAFSEFHLQNTSVIDSYEKQIYANGKPFDESLPVIERIATCEKALKAFDELKSICYRSYGGTIYFQDMWEHCHNSREECFSFDAHIKEQLDYLLQNKDDLIAAETALQTLRPDLIQYLSEHPAVLQKNIYSDFNPMLKYKIQQELRTMEKENIITRTKYKNSYILELK